jgi:hypothetical protein
MRVPLTESVLGWATAMGEVLVIVVIVAAGSIRVDMSTWRINLARPRSIDRFTTLCFRFSFVVDKKKAWFGFC